MRMAAYLLLGLGLGFLFLLSGCATETVITKPEFYERPPLVISDPEPVRQIPVEWVIITKENFEKRVAELEKSGGTVVLFAVTSEGYQSLSLNAAELRRFISQQKSIIGAMKQYYEKKKDDQK